MDQTIAKGYFLGCKRDSWIKMAGMEEGKVLVINLLMLLPPKMTII
jgi:hypothetical protein